MGLFGRLGCSMQIYIDSCRQGARSGSIRVIGIATSTGRPGNWIYRNFVHTVHLSLLLRSHRDLPIRGRRVGPLPTWKFGEEAASTSVENE
jgi:hypothetical protein